MRISGRHLDAQARPATKKCGLPDSGAGRCDGESSRSRRREKRRVRDRVWVGQFQAERRSLWSGVIGYGSLIL